MECIPSFCAHISLLRPLEIIFRYLTYRWRVLPDVIVLGEVRCGTTSLCQHFASLRQRRRRQDKNDTNDNSQQAEIPIIDCRTPFCLWAHPELDHKETFFFVGHYLGYVTPEAYRMCFPLKSTKWFNEMKWKLMNYYYERMGKQTSTTIQQQPLFMTFDGCAQYLTSPTAAALIAEAYRAANQPPPILIACVREPIDQARSWWRYENNAMVWGDSMSLTKYNKDLRGDHYPPVTSDDALRFSLNSTTTTKLYKRAEYLFSQDNNSNKLEQATKRCVSVTIPYWAMTWPGGQLSGIGRNALFVENIMSFLFDILKKLSNRRARHKKKNVDPEFDSDLYRFIKNTITTGVHRNAAAATYSKEELFSKQSEDFFQVEKQKLLSLCKLYDCCTIDLNTKVRVTWAFIWFHLDMFYFLPGCFLIGLLIYLASLELLYHSAPLELVYWSLTPFKMVHLSLCGGRYIALNFAIASLIEVPFATAASLSAEDVEGVSTLSRKNSVVLVLRTPIVSVSSHWHCWVGSNSGSGFISSSFISSMVDLVVC
ncbi:hypothetical protein FRACYDRAFT_238103 [Fragilariopsis cylindrus CCMP1102]|uniref:Sulfotransferase domain-containing protein n=1 Tax=Fragilariopsis cylindrus CCMP1102 TaxID=635003 RepID=A0A1E7FHQ4_9STRA|nr:hypothetical protein FRACYDRAFT_238103 [Fragilariopsis cylindrus CCMP1102]|eukprot:OEU17677.1 hypothetical protein FRACYDRAFT_238103 [Fragilariopsis cylindrus CCMP1102]